MRCATSRTVPGSIPAGVTGNVFRGTPDRTMCPEVDSASESEYEGFLLDKSGRCVWLTTYHPCSAETSRKSGALIYPEPLGPPRPVAGHLCFTFITSDDVLKICSKHVEVDWRNQLRINSATSWSLLHRYIEMHGQQNIKYIIIWCS